MRTTETTGSSVNRTNRQEISSEHTPMSSSSSILVSDSRFHQLVLDPPRNRGEALHAFLEILKQKNLRILDRSDWNLVVKVCSIAIAQLRYYGEHASVLEDLAGRVLPGDQLDHYVWDSLSSDNYRKCFDERLKEIHQATQQESEHEAKVILMAVAMRVFSWLLDPSRQTLPENHCLHRLQVNICELRDSSIWTTKERNTSYPLEELLLGYIVAGRTILEESAH